ncbi:MAG: hypothetical protein FD180_755 [Planctomycetota bacterium]|nr:MAG: hypothetical protein FD180_755 [Planctomycetota bacterium]
MDAKTLRRNCFALAALAAFAGCSSTSEEEMPPSVAIRLEETSVQEAKNRMVLKRLLGREDLSLGRMMARSVEEELEADGITARSPAVASRGTRDEAFTALRGDGGERGLFVIHMGTWDLEAISTSGKATVDYEFLLFDANGREIWTEGVSRRTVTLRTGEQRDIEAFIRRLAVESLRSRPLRTRPP